jgi:hypothetical protein
MVIFDQNSTDLFEHKYNHFLNKMIEIFNKPDSDIYTLEDLNWTL